MYEVIVCTRWTREVRVTAFEHERIARRQYQRALQQGLGARLLALVLAALLDRQRLHAT